MPMIETTATPADAACVADDVFRPLFFAAADADARAALAALVAGGRVLRQKDVLEQQLRGLAGVRCPDQTLDGDKFDAWCEALLQGQSRDRWGAWVYYPWNGTAVHLLPAALFRELRLNRNRNKITLAEQRVLAQKTVGIVGLSVGNAMALTLAMEGCFGTIKLADYDRLELSNLNRIRAGVCDLDLPKTVLAARQIAEQDPYLDVQIFSDGIQEDNLDAFFDGAPGLDLLVEECDNMLLKLRLRHEARARRIPVVMESSDRGVLDIERFDLEPTRAILHGLAEGVPLDGPRDRAAQMAVALKINRLQDVSPRMAASLLEIGATLNTWPQLAADVIAGGGHVTHAVRAVFLDQHRQSGRWILDGLGHLHQPPLLGGDGPLAAAAETAAPTGAEHVDAVPDAAPAALTDAMQRILKAALQAPSGGNSQPWRFWVDGRRIWLQADEPTPRNRLNFDDRPAWLAHGMATENAVLAAAELGGCLTVQVLPQPQRPDLCALWEWRPDQAPAEGVRADLAAWLFQRRTTRCDADASPRRAFPSAALTALLGATVSMQVWEDAAERARLAELLAIAERIRCLHPALHQELFAEVFRHDPAAAERRTGLEWGELALDGVRDLTVRLLERPAVAAACRAVDGAQVLRAGFAAPIAASPALLGFSLPGDRPGDWFALGRAVERCWLQLTALGWCVQPIGTTLFMLRLLQDGSTLDFNAAEQRDLYLAAQGLHHEFGIQANRATFLLRCFPSDRTLPASRRKPLASVVAEGAPPR